MNTPDDMRYISFDNKNGSYRIRVPGTGQIATQTLEEAIKERDLRLHMVQKGKINIDANTTFKDWFDIWLERYCTTNNQHTKEGYEDDIERCCKTIYCKKMLDIKPYQISELLIDMAKKNYAYSTIKRTRAILRTVFRSIRDNGFIEYDRLPTDGVRLPPKTATKYVSKDRRAFNTILLENLVKAAQHFSYNNKTCKTYTAALLILTRTGLRLSELLGLCREDISFINDDEMIISISRTVHDIRKDKSIDGRSWIISPPKSENSRRKIMIKDKRCADHARYMCSFTNKTVIYDGQGYNFIFATKTGRPICKSTFIVNFIKIRKKIGSDIRIHEIRHSIATLMANNPAVSYNNAAAFLGHSLNVFMNIYVHSNEDVLNSCSNAISDAFKDSEPTKKT